MSTVNLAIRTSRLGPAARALYLKLRGDAVDLPPHPATSDKPEVFLGWDPLDEGPPEYLTVLTNPDETLAEWARMGAAGRDETFVLDVLVRTQTASELDQLEAWDRLVAVCAAVEEVAYDATNGKPRAIGYENERRTGRVGAVELYLELSDAGWRGRGIVRFFLSARI